MTRLIAWVASLGCVVLILATVAPARSNEPGLDGKPEHPLAWTIRYAAVHESYIRDTIRDYTCQLIKRERINGELQDYQFIRVQVRCEQRRNGEVEKPLAVFMQYLAPRKLKDRRLLYIENQHRGRVLVRKGGAMMRHLRLTVDPHSRSARGESNYPITDVGFDKIIQRLIERVTEDMAADPLAENTQVMHFADAKVNNRLCTHIRVVHPKPMQGVDFHIASLYLDNELRVPTRLIVQGWPEKEGEKPPVNEEYTYVNLKLNVGLTEEDFSEAKLGSPSTSDTARAR